MYNDCFKYADTKEKCFWLGFIYCDSGINKKAFTLEITSKDELLMHAFVTFIGYDTCIIKDRIIRNLYKNEYRTYTAKSIYISDSQFLLDIAQYGIFGLKRDRTIFPRFSSYELQLAFLSGCYEADGTANSTEIAQGNINILEHIKHIYKIENKIRYKKNTIGSTYLLAIGAEFKRTLIDNFKSPLDRKWIRSNSNRVYTKLKNRINGQVLWLEQHIDIIKSDILNESLDNIALKYKCSYKTLSKFLRSHDIPIQSAKDKAIETRKFNPSKEELEHLIKVEKIPFTRLGKMYNVSDNAVRKRARLFGIALK